MYYARPRPETMSQRDDVRAASRDNLSVSCLTNRRHVAKYKRLITDETVCYSHLENIEFVRVLLAFSLTSLFGDAPACGPIVADDVE